MEHFSELKERFEAVFSQASFQSSSRARFLLLEGEDEFREVHAGDQGALAWLDAFMDSNAAEAPFSEVLAGGGLKRLFRDAPVETELSEALRADITGHFQALSFRA